MNNKSINQSIDLSFQISMNCLSLIEDLHIKLNINHWNNSIQLNVNDNVFSIVYDEKKTKPKNCATYLWCRVSCTIFRGGFASVYLGQCGNCKSLIDKISQK